MLNFKKIKSSQALIEIIVAMALAMFFLSAFVANLGFITTRYADYQQKKYGYDLMKNQKTLNDKNLSYFLTANKMLKGNLANGYFPDQGSHLSYTYVNYAIDKGNFQIKNQEKKLFFNDYYSYYWSFDAIPTDSTYILDDTGNADFKGTPGCSGTACSNPTIISPNIGKCVNNNCIQFAGTTSTMSSISLPTSTVLNAMTKTTWEAWIYPTNVSNDQAFISKQGNNYFKVLNSKAYISLNIGGSQRTLDSTSTLVNNTWYHVVATFDGQKIRMYVNGSLEKTSATYAGDLNFGTTNLIIGGYTATSPTGFAGYIDEIKIYKYALADNEILNRYNAFRDQIGLLAFWHFDDALNAATYSGVGNGTGARFTSFSVPDNLPLSVVKASTNTGKNICFSGSCANFNRAYSSKGTFSDASNAYPAFHNPSKLTIEMRIKPTVVNTGYQGLVSKTYPGIYETYLNGSNIVFGLNVGGTTYRESYAANVVANTWYLLDFTFDGTNMNLYIDGALKQSWNHPGTITADGAYKDLLVAYTGTANEYFDGTIEDIRIYNRALSIDEINNRYDGGYTYYQYYKPVCKAASGEVLDSECLNCNPINGTECTSSKTHDKIEPLLAKSIHYLKFGKGISPNEIKREQTISVVNSFFLQPANSSIWAGGIGQSNSYGCNEFVFGREGASSDSKITYNGACGLSTCGKFVYESEVCDASNVSFYRDNGCTACSGTPGEVGATCTMCTANGRFQLTSTGSDGYFISPTFNFSKRMNLTSFAWKGTNGPLQFQFSCLDSIIDQDGNQVSEDTWQYFGPDPSNSSRCSSSYYYSLLPGVEGNPSTCWETDNQTNYNCQFFRFKIKLTAANNPIVNNMWFIFGQYPYSVLKNQ